MTPPSTKNLKTLGLWIFLSGNIFKPITLISLVGRIRGGKLPGRSHKNENRVNSYKGMTPPSTQNLKALGLRVFFLICCSTFSFLPNMELRLTLEYLTTIFIVEK